MCGFQDKSFEDEDFEEGQRVDKVLLTVFFFVSAVLGYVFVRFLLF
jgi:hypothetical protein